MSHSQNLSDDRMSEVLAEYLEEVERLDRSGDVLRELRARFVEAHPDLASQLRAHFDDEDVIDEGRRRGGRVKPRFARYSEVSRLGEGAMGVVYKGFDQQLKRWVALKVPAIDATALDEARRIRTEAESMAQLTHRNIVKIFDVQEDAGSTVICMELIPGGSLQDQLHEFKDQRSLAQLMVDLARAVHHAHQRGILHRDLKPANVLLGRDENGALHPYVSDFGLAKPIGATDSSSAGTVATGHGTQAYGRIVGTVSYMSPEQAAGQHATTLSDVYGLGGILYALLTGQPPFRDESPAETLALVHDPTRRPRPPSDFNRSIDVTLAAICLRCLEKNPEDRYRSAEGLAKDLDRWLANRPTDARPLGALARAGLWCRRSPLAASLVAAVLALGGLAGLEIADRVAEPGRIRRAAAQQTAALLVSRLEDIKTAVESTAAHPQLGPLLVHRDWPALQALIDEEGDTHDDLDGTSPFESLFVIDRRDGEMVVRWPVTYPESEGVDFRARDYYQGLLASADSGAYVSQAFRAVTDQLFKFGVSARITYGDDTVGAVVATVTTSASMGLANVGNESLVTAVLGLRDPNPLPGEVGATQEDASPYVILLHPAYEAGVEPRWLPQRYMGELRRGEVAAYRDPVAELGGTAAKSYAGEWVATFAPVPGTDFMVMVQQR